MRGPVVTAWPVTALPGSAAAQAAVVRRALAGLADVTTADRLLAEPPPPTRYVVPELLPHGLAILYGRPKQGKSWLALDLALAVACDGKVAGSFPVEPGDVLYFALEDGPSRLHERTTALLGDGEPGPPGLTFITRLRSDLFTTVRAWHAAATSPRLVIVDTLQRARGPARANVNAYAEDYSAIGAVKALADELGICILLVHHSRKALSEHDVDAASGSYGIVGAADTGWHLRPAVEDVAGLGVWSRDARGGEWALRRVGPAWQVTDGPIPDASLGDRSARILAFVASRPDGVRAEDVARELDVDPATARTYLARLVSSERIQRPGRGLYTPVASVSSVSSDGWNDTDATDATGPYGGVA